MAIARRAERQEQGWSVVEGGAREAAKRVLLLPGLLCTDLIYSDMMADTAFAEAQVHVLAANPPGFRGQPVPGGFDFGIASYAEVVEDFARSNHVGLVVGHDFFANVGIEIAARGRFRGKVMLISPSLFRTASPAQPRLVDWLTRQPILGHAVLSVGDLMMNELLMAHFSDAQVERRQQLIAEAKLTPKAVAGNLVRAFFDHLDRHGDLTNRLKTTQIPICYVRGQSDTVRLPAEHRKSLEQHDRIVVREMDGCRHFAMMDRPRALVDLAVDMLGP